MLRLKETLIAILVVLSLGVHNAIAHLTHGNVFSTAYVKVDTSENRRMMEVYGGAGGRIGDAGDFVHPDKTAHTGDIYIHLTIAEIFPLNINYVVFKYGIFKRSLFHNNEDRQYISGTESDNRSLMGPCLRGTAYAYVRLQFLVNKDMVTQRVSSMPDSACACPLGEPCPQGSAHAFTEAEHAQFRQELADMVALSNDSNVIGAFNVNGRIFLQHANTTYVYIVDGKESRIESENPNADVVEINLEDGIESELVDLIPAAPPASSYKPLRLARTWGVLKKNG